MLDLELDTAPETTPISVAEAKANMQITHDEHDGTISDMIAGAVGHLDGYSGVLGRALVEQTWVLHLDHFPTTPNQRIRLPLPPLIGVEEIAYIDPDGVDQVLDAGLYKVLAGERSQVEPAYGETWPATRRESRAVSIKFTCGWAVPAQGATWPTKLAPIRRALLLIVGDLYENREAQVVSTGVVSAVQNPRVQDLLRLLKIPRV